MTKHLCHPERSEGSPLLTARSSPWTFLTAITLASVLLGTSACTMSHDRSAEATANASEIDEPVDFYARPAVASVESNSFDALWTAAEDAAWARLFRIDRRDRRGGVMTTEPLTSAQFFEPWRRDTPGLDQTAESSLATIRRTVRFEFTREGEDSPTFTVTPKVLVERYSQAENRVSSVVLYRSAFRAGRVSEITPYGTRETDRGIFLPSRYWYPLDRDEELERQIAADIQRKIGGAAASPATKSD
jgi:hypothetical protein